MSHCVAVAFAAIPATPFDREDAPAARAHATLRQGIHHVAQIAPWADRVADRRQAIVRARYIGNCLRELDRFLGVLLDTSRTTGPTRLLTLKPDTATRIAAYAGDGWDAQPAQLRLRALDRSRMCLLHDAGRVGRGDEPLGRWLTSGWRDAGSFDLRRYALGSDLRPNALHLHDIARFYAGLGDRVMSGGRAA